MMKSFVRAVVVLASMAGVIFAAPLTRGGTVSYCQVRLTVTAWPTSNPNNDLANFNSGVAIAEIQLVSGESRLSWSPGTTVTALPDKTDTEGKAQLIDGDYGTKYYSSNASNGKYVFTIVSPSAVAFDGYALSAADQDGRNPLAWTLEGSDDGLTWTLLDSQALTAADVNDWTWSGNSGTSEPGASQVKTFRFGNLYTATVNDASVNFSNITWTGGELANASDSWATLTLTGENPTLTLDGVSADDKTLTLGRLSIITAGNLTLSSALTTEAIGVLDLSGCTGTTTVSFAPSASVIAGTDVDFGDKTVASLTIGAGRKATVEAVSKVTTLTRQSGSTLKLTGAISGARSALPLQDNMTLETSGNVVLTETVNETLKGRSWTLSGGVGRCPSLYLRSGDDWSNPGANGTFTMCNGATLAVESSAATFGNGASDGAMMLCVSGGSQTVLVEGVGTTLSAPNGAINLSRDGAATVTVRDGATLSAYKLGGTHNSSTLTIEGATLALGKSGATDGLMRFNTCTLNLNDGAILAANGDWSVGAGSSDRKILVNGAVTVKPSSHTVTLRKLSGAGSLATEGAGSVVFADGTLPTGTLSVGGSTSVSLGSARPTLAAVSLSATVELIATVNELAQSRIVLPVSADFGSVAPDKARFVVKNGGESVTITSVTLADSALTLALPSTLPTWTAGTDNNTWSNAARWSNLTEGQVPTSGEVIINFGDSETPVTLTVDTENVALNRATFAGTAKGVVTGTLTAEQIVFVTSLTLPLATANSDTDGIAVPAGMTLTVDAGVDGGALTKAISGAGAFAKIGTGTLTTNAAVNTARGSTVAEGTLKFGSVAIGGGSYSGAGDIRVVSGATLDYNGKSDGWTRTVTLEAEATLANDASAIGSTSRQLVNITLAGDATVRAVGDFGFIAGSYAATRLDLAGHTLTKAGAGTFWICNTTVTAGTLKVDGGAFRSVNNKATTFQGATVFVSDLANAFRLNNGTVSLAGALTKNGSGSMTLGGSVSGTGAINANAGMLSITGAVTDSRAITVAAGATLVFGNGSQTRSNLPFGSATVNGTLTLDYQGSMTYGTNLPSASGTIVLKRGTLKVQAANGDFSGTWRVEQGATLTNEGSINYNPFISPRGSLEVNGRLLLKPNANGESHIWGALSGAGTVDVQANCSIEGAITLTGALTVNAGVTLAGVTSLVGPDITVNGTLSGPVSVVQGKTLAGVGTLSGAVTFKPGAILDATANTAEVALTVNTPVFEGGVTVTAAAGATANTLIVKTGAAATPAVAEAMTVTGVTLLASPSGNNYALVTPPVIGDLPQDTPAAVQTELQRIAAANGITNPTLEGSTAGQSLTGAQLEGALECFSGVVTVPTVGGTVIDVSYDFGIERLTIKTLTVEGVAGDYVVLAAKVQGKAAATAGYTDGTAVEVWLNGAKCETAVPMTDDPEGSTPAAGVKWFRIPHDPTATSTFNFTVKAVSATATP